MRDISLIREYVGPMVRAVPAEVMIAPIIRIRKLLSHK